MDAPTIGGWDSIVGAYARGDAVFGEFILLLAALTLPLLPVSLVLLQITFELSVMVLAVVGAAEVARPPQAAHQGAQGRRRARLRPRRLPRQAQPPGGARSR